MPSNAEEIPGTEFKLVATAVVEAIGQGVRDRYEGVDADGRGLHDKAVGSVVVRRR